MNYDVYLTASALTTSLAKSWSVCPPNLGVGVESFDSGVTLKASFINSGNRAFFGFDVSILKSPVIIMDMFFSAVLSKHGIVALRNERQSVGKRL